MRNTGAPAWPSLALVSVLLLAGLSPAHAGGEPPAPVAGFRGVPLGTPLAALPRLEAVESRGPGRLCYERRDEDLRLGDGVAASIRWCFYRDVLEAVEIVARGGRNTAALLDVLQAEYGSGRREGSGLRGGPLRILWQGTDASAWYGEPRDCELAQARIWIHEPGRAPRAAAPARPGQRGAYAPAPPPAGTLEIAVPKRVRRGMVARVTVRFRGAAAPASVHVLLPPRVALQGAVPEARREADGVLVWENLAGGSASLKLELLIGADVPPGASPPLQAVLFDAVGGRSEATAALVVR